MDSRDRVCPVCGQAVESVVRRHKTLGAWVPVWGPGPCRNPDCATGGAGQRSAPRAPGRRESRREAGGRETRGEPGGRETRREFGGFGGEESRHEPGGEETRGE